jgi:hypothetical protein
MLLISSYYTSDLTSQLTLGQPSVAVKSFQDVINRGYRVIVQRDTAHQDFLRGGIRETMSNA